MGPGESVLVTGCTGFVGKVVLAELMRRREELGIGTVYVLIRPKRGKMPAERFQEAIVPSDCFRLLPLDWHTHCQPIAGDVTAAGLALEAVDRVMLQGAVQRIIHCAASVDFDLPLAQAADANITGALNMLAFAKQCAELRAFVDVSTAYVAPHPGGVQSFEEALVSLPVSPSETYRAILDGTARERELLALTGHANTYALTKCIAEHLLVEQRGDVPLTIVRPSIISACRQHPFPGWIDSKAAFAGFVALYGMGHLRVLGVDPEVKLDIVPCDEVAERVLGSAFGTPPSDGVSIRYAVAGLSRSITIREICASTQPLFDRYPTGPRAGFNYVGITRPAMYVRELFLHRLPLWLGLGIATLTGQKRQEQSIKRLLKALLYLNRGFRYFTHRTFDFRPSEPTVVPGFDPAAYFETVSRGIHRHLLRQGERKVMLGGQQHRDGQGDLWWTLRQQQGNPVHRLLGYMLRKAFRRAVDAVTFDQASFETAMAEVRQDELLVIVPSHRSYADFLLCPFLFFARPELGIPMPHIAATEDFARIPIIGEVLRWAQAFYIKRGLGREDPDLTRRVAELVADRQALTFFIEGTRSRSRRFLAPRRGLLRALQSTGQSCVILPVAITYDRVPEEAVMLRELSGAAEAPERLASLVRWVGKLWRGKVRLGRVHVACGRPVRLAPTSDVHALSREVVAELQDATVSSGYHLRAFLTMHPEAGLDHRMLTRLLEARGAMVIDSSLPLAAEMDALNERCLRHQWQHHFYADALRLLPDHPAVRHYVERNGYVVASASTPLAPLELLRALFEPVCRDYKQVACHLTNAKGSALGLKLSELAAALPGVLRQELEGVLSALVERRILTLEGDVYGWGEEANAIEAYAKACRWPAEPGSVSKNLSQAAGASELSAAR